MKEGKLLLGFKESVDPECFQYLITVAGGRLKERNWEINDERNLNCLFFEQY